METALFDASTLSMWWALPFGIFLLALAFMPLAAPRFWHHHEIKWVAAFIAMIGIPFGMTFGFSTLCATFWNTMSHHYIPFLTLMACLFVVCGGVHITTKGRITPLGNTVFLLFGSTLSSVIGTTGASILLIRPYLVVNHHRFHKKYLVIFFIFTISNIGGCLTPIGDPPLFLGFLNGVHFFWPFQHMLLPFFMVTLPILVIFYYIDRHHYRYKNPSSKEAKENDDHPYGEAEKFNIYGKRNLSLLGIAVGTIVISGVGFNPFPFWREAVLILITILSYISTPRSVHYMNRFNFAPLKEVAVIFLAIFVTLIPIEEMLHLGKDGPFSGITSFVHPHGMMDPLRYYVLTGLLSSFLDNAPTYLLFFHMAGGRAQDLMTIYAPILLAISSASVFWGAMTYIGNAPNFMVKSIAERMHIRMPSFFGYMKWSFGILLPILLVFGTVQFVLLKF